MATMPASRVELPDSGETNAARFQRLAAVWLSETAHISSTSDLIAHPAFREIVGMSEAAIPLLLRELQIRSPGHWHRALRQITGTDPVPTADRGNIDKAADAWLQWGKERGYEW